MTDEVLERVRCPDSRMRLLRGEAGLVARLNQLITAGQLRNRSGVTLKKPLSGLLLREDRRLGYPVVDDIPILLVDEAIVLD